MMSFRTGGLGDTKRPIHKQRPLPKTVRSQHHSLRSLPIRNGLTAMRIGTIDLVETEHEKCSRVTRHGSTLYWHTYRLTHSLQSIIVCLEINIILFVPISSVSPLSLSLPDHLCPLRQFYFLFYLCYFIHSNQLQLDFLSCFLV